MENASKALIIAGAILISILLISIGIILINSGRDITETGTSGMNSQKIQTFNSQFTAYEGKRKGSEIKNLANVVRASNASDAEHQVVLTINGAKASGETIAATSLAALTNSKNYNVVLKYSTASTDTLANAATGTAVVNPNASFKTEPGYVMGIEIQEVGGAGAAAGGAAAGA